MFSYFDFRLGPTNLPTTAWTFPQVTWFWPTWKTIWKTNKGWNKSGLDFVDTKLSLVPQRWPLRPRTRKRTDTPTSCRTITTGTYFRKTSIRFQFWAISQSASIAILSQQPIRFLSVNIWRHPMTYPFLCSRVILNALVNATNSDYINASTVVSSAKLSRDSSLISSILHWTSFSVSLFEVNCYYLFEG